MNTYDPNEVLNQKSKMAGWKKGLLIFLIIALVVVGLGVGCQTITKRAFTNSNNGPLKFDEDYIGELHIEGTISDDDSSSLLSGSGYHHQWLMDKVDQMMDDSNNKGIILYVNTPGGSVYPTDEMYLKLMEYKKQTGRPVYTYMGSMAASGGYYISSASDKIIANRNCWTGSIGVTIGTIYDVTGLLEKMGVKTVTINSGKNKAMGSATIKMTQEQKEIFQGLVDDAYDQFVKIVAEGRSMKLSQVKKLADGRVYTAKQAKANGLVDDIATFDEAVYMMKTENNLHGCVVENITYNVDSSLIGRLMSQITDLKGDTATSEYDQLKALIGENNKFSVTYLSNIQK